MALIDLNCDLGEGGAHDAELLALVTSANVACGAHAGDATTIAKTLETAKQHNVRIGAHPGYFDRQQFGRGEHHLPSDQMVIECICQIAGLKAFAERAGMPVAYMKPHGALYNQACRETQVALAVIEAAQFFAMPLLGLPNSEMQTLCLADEMFVREGFADRRYLPDGRLVPRDRPNALIESPDEAIEQAEWLIAKENVRSLCVHGDNPAAVEFVRKLRERLTTRGHQIVPFA
ncbi:MAG: LamB/YcsF family protein [Gemmataceae bacterium]